jgi:hypothetical protein
MTTVERITAATLRMEPVGTPESWAITVEQAVEKTAAERGYVPVATKTYRPFSATLYVQNVTGQFVIGFARFYGRNWDDTYGFSADLERWADWEKEAAQYVDTEAVEEIPF